MSVNTRVQQYRDRMRERGFKQVHLWVANTGQPGFAQEAARQSALVAAADRAGDDQDFVDEISMLGQD
jgi:hypothetical protein